MTATKRIHEHYVEDELDTFFENYEQYGNVSPEYMLEFAKNLVARVQQNERTLDELLEEIKRLSGESD
jgi:transcription termination factor NusB